MSITSTRCVGAFSFARACTVLVSDRAQLCEQGREVHNSVGLCPTAPWGNWRFFRVDLSGGIVEMGRNESAGMNWSAYAGITLRLPWTESGVVEAAHTPTDARVCDRSTPVGFTEVPVLRHSDQSSVFVNRSGASSGDDCSPASVHLETGQDAVFLRHFPEWARDGRHERHTLDSASTMRLYFSKSADIFEDFSNQRKLCPSPSASLISWSAEINNDREKGDLVGRILSAALLSWVADNEQTRARGMQMQEASPFHASRIPSISVEAYFERIYTFAFCSKACYVIALLYLDRLSARNANLALTSFTAHRLLITAVMLAAKFFDDIFYNNAYYAKVGGLPLSEMNALEVRMLRELSYQLNVSVEEFYNFESMLINRAVRSAPELGRQLSESGFPLHHTLWHPLSPSLPIPPAWGNLCQNAPGNDPQTPKVVAGWPCVWIKQPLQIDCPKIEGAMHAESRRVSYWH